MSDQIPVLCRDETKRSDSNLHKGFQIPRLEIRKQKYVNSLLVLQNLTIA